MTSAGYLRSPHLNGDLLAFVAEDDIWLAPVAGGRGWRLSADGAPVSNPRFARDGGSVAWTSWRDGPAEVYLAGVAGERGRRLTYWGEADATVCGWTPDGEILALTASGQPFERQTWAHAVPVDGGPPRRLPFGPVASVAVEPTARALLNGTWGRDPAYWKRYRGGTAGRLWTSVDGGPFQRILATVNGQFASPMLVGGRLAFLSDHEGTGNVYSCLLDGSDLRRHTDHDGFYARQASTDGRHVVYQCQGEIWILDDLTPDSQPRPVAITLGSASTALAPRLISAEDHLGALSCDHAGLASAVEVRGTVHWLTHRDGPARALSVDAGARARLPKVLGRTGHVVWVTDAGRADALETGPAEGPELVPGMAAAPPRRLAEGQVGLASELAAAPDGSTVAVAARDGRLLLVEVESGAVTQLAESTDGEVSGLAYSPDSAWLAWSHPGPPPLSRIRLARVAGAAAGELTVVDVTDGRFIDSEPVFTTDGKFLAFLSARVFDPVYDAHFFDLSFPYGARPYLVPLAAATPSPFGPLPGGRPPGSGPAKPGPGAGGAGLDGSGPGVTGDSRAKQTLVVGGRKFSLDDIDACLQSRADIGRQTVSFVFRACDTRDRRTRSSDRSLGRRGSRQRFDRRRNSPRPCPALRLGARGRDAGSIRGVAAHGHRQGRPQGACRAGGEGWRKPGPGNRAQRARRRRRSNSGFALARSFEPRARLRPQRR